MKEIKYINKYQQLMDDGLINTTFSFELFEGPGYRAVIFGGESREPQQAAEQIKSYIAKVKAEHLSFLQGVRLGTFTVPGDGAIDFGPIFDVLAENDYEGYVLVEAEQDPAIANPFEYALKARKYIAEKAGL